MAKPVQSNKKTVNGKAVAAVTLAVILVLTIAAGIIGVSGMKLDQDGLYKLLAWIPTPSQSSTWREALVPGTDLGDNMVQIYTVAPLEEGAAVTAEQLKETVNILTRRLAFGGWSSAQAEVVDGSKIKLSLPLDGTHDHAFEMLAAKGDFALASPDGTPFVTYKNVKQASYGVSGSDGTYAVSFILDNEGKEAFAEKTTELMGQSISLMIDGVAVASPGINTPLTTGQASLPGFNNENSVAYASMMQYGPLPLSLVKESQVMDGAPLFGENAANTLIIALFIAAALVCLYVLFTYRLGGLIAVWLLAIQLIAAYFFAALLGAGFTVSTLLAVWGSFALLAWALLILYRSMKRDLARGRSIRQSLKESYSGGGKVAIDALAVLLVIAVVLIIADHQTIGAFMLPFAIGLIIDLALVGICLRVLLGSAITVFGTSTSLYISAKKEAA